jgi:DNA-binding beta-propeller fold protein YncE
MGVAISVDGAFALVADSYNNMIRRIEISSGTVTTLAGNTSAGLVDGAGTLATFNRPSSVAIDPSGAFALVADPSNNCIRRIQLSTRAVTTFAGSSSTGSVDGNGTLAKFNNPMGVAISPDGVFALVADQYNCRIRRIEMSTGVVSTLAGSFGFPTGVAISADGSFVLVADSNNHMIRRIEISSGTVTTLAGNSSAGFVDGTGSSVMFNRPQSVAIDPSGASALVADYGNDCVRSVDLATRSVSTLSGTLSGMPYGKLTFQYAHDVSIAPNGAFALVIQIYSSTVRYISMSSMCKAGFYCPYGSSKATQSLCNAGFYCPAGSSSSNQSICNAGFYCPAGSPTQLRCSAGSFCPPGSSVASPFNCSAGFYCPAGSSSPNQTICNSGFYCPAGVPIKISCSAGHFCAAGSSQPNDFTTSSTILFLPLC